jgi:hypothetical protein
LRLAVNHFEAHVLTWAFLRHFRAAFLSNKIAELAWVYLGDLWYVFPIKPPVKWLCLRSPPTVSGAKVPLEAIST